MLGHVTINCATEGCYAIITLHRSDEERLRKTHETFYCAGGHKNFFPGKTDEEKRIEELERLLSSARMTTSYRVTDLESACRAAAVCPFGCGWISRKYVRRETLEDGATWNLRAYFDRVGRDMAEHLRAEHGARRETVLVLGPGADEEVVDATVVS